MLSILKYARRAIADYHALGCKLTAIGLCQFFVAAFGQRNDLAFTLQAAYLKGLGGAANRYPLSPSVILPPRQSP